MANPLFQVKLKKQSLSLKLGKLLLLGNSLFTARKLELLPPFPRPLNCELPFNNALPYTKWSSESLHSTHFPGKTHSLTMHRLGQGLGNPVCNHLLDYLEGKKCSCHRWSKMKCCRCEGENLGSSPLLHSYGMEKTASSGERQRLLDWQGAP